jgi:hypothetical protein
MPVWQEATTDFINIRQETLLFIAALSPAFMLLTDEL